MDISPDKTFGTCEYCGSTMTLPKIDDDTRAAAFNRGNHFRRSGEFDKALAVYEKIVEEDPNDAEAHWCCVLCRFGIEWVEDPATTEYLPTCHRASFEPFTEDIDCKAAIDLSDGITKKQYQRDAAKIAEVQKGILATSRDEEPFDVFICYKESDDNGNRTIDSTLAQDVYYQLTDQGFRTFFARITLEDKVGSEYEPYIFAALNSAKAMVVIGTKPEHFNAVWVKNEWSRYLSVVKRDRSKVLLPCYRDMDPYDLPEQLSILQSYDMAKIGFMQDLIRGIKKIVNVDEPKPTVKETVVMNAGAANIVPLLKRTFIFLEDGEWEKADSFCEQVLNQDPECAEAYLGKLMAELHVHRREDLVNCDDPFDNNNNFQKAVRFGDEKFTSEMRGYIAHINERNENARLTGIYNGAVSAMNAANTESAYKAAADTFKSISGFKDADEKFDTCKRKIEEIKAKEEADRLERERQAEQKRIAAEKAAKKRKKVIAITTPIVIACIAFLIVLTTVIIPKQKLNKAMGLLDSGDYEAAYALLEEMGNSDAIASSKYDRAVALINSNDYEAAYILLNGLEYKDSAEKAKEIFEKYEIEKLKTASVGDIVYFGAYEQDNNTSNGKEDIEWLVLAKEGNKALVISKYALDCQQYNTSYTSVTWETCSLRKWLNGTFLNAAFSSEEQSSIISSTVTADKNPSYSTSPGNNTTDKVFLLSITEVNKYFSSDSARQCSATAYAKAQGAYTNTSNGNCWWWLRSCGYDSDHAACVSIGGSVGSYGINVSISSDAVRPALWINLGS